MDSASRKATLGKAPRQARGARTRDRLLHLAQEAIIEKGFNATSIEEPGRWGLHQQERLLPLIGRQARTFHDLVWAPFPPKRR